MQDSYHALAVWKSTPVSQSLIRHSFQNDVSPFQPGALFSVREFLQRAVYQKSSKSYTTSVVGLKTKDFLGKNKNSCLCHQKLVFKPPTSALGCWNRHLTSCTRLVSGWNWAAAAAAYLAQSRLVWLLCNPLLMRALVRGKLCVSDLCHASDKSSLRE